MRRAWIAFHPRPARSRAVPSRLYKDGVCQRTPQQRLSAAQDVAHGLEYLHSNSPPILHRDIKPSNVFLVRSLSPAPQGRSRGAPSVSPQVPARPLFLLPTGPPLGDPAPLQDHSGSFRIADFGLARFLAPAGEVMTGETGTYLYMAPEVIRHEARAQPEPPAAARRGREGGRTGERCFVARRLPSLCVFARDPSREAPPLCRPLSDRSTASRQMCSATACFSRNLSRGTGRTRTTLST